MQTPVLQLQLDRERPVVPALPTWLQKLPDLERTDLPNLPRWLLHICIRVCNYVKNDGCYQGAAGCAVLNDDGTCDTCQYGMRKADGKCWPCIDLDGAVQIIQVILSTSAVKTLDPPDAEPTYFR
jgi:hypothetical protein